MFFFKISYGFLSLSEGFFHLGKCNFKHFVFLFSVIDDFIQLFNLTFERSFSDFELIKRFLNFYVFEDLTEMLSCVCFQILKLLLSEQTEKKNNLL